MPSHDTAFTIQTGFAEDGLAVVTLTGEFDRTAAPALAEHIRSVLARRPAQVVYEMSEARYLDNAATRTLVQEHRRLAGGGPVLRHCPPIVRRLLEVNGLGALCVFDPGREAGP